jgi:hypothetical protein
MMQSRPLANGDPFEVVDLVICALVLCLGALPFVLYEKAPDYLHEDVNYLELAKSLLLDHSYINNFVSERVQPPGLPIILAGVCATLDCNHDTLIRTMPVFFALGLLVSYAVIRRQRGRLVAAGSCLLLASSPALFVFLSSSLWPSYAYFFVSMLVLSLAPKLERQASASRRFLAAALLAFLLVAAVMIQSAGIALIGALLGWTVLSFLRSAPAARSRIKLLAPAILLALLVQTLWWQRGSNAAEWPLPGYPKSYFSQLKVKSGNYPELGYATPKDVVFRVENNLKDHTRYLIGDVLIGRWISPSWGSIGIAGSLILVALGVGSSLLHDDSQLCALYFVGYEFIYLLWPWSFETPRFMLPILALACLYLAEGTLAVWRWSQQIPQRIGAVFLPVSVVLAFFEIREAWAGGTARGFQDKISAVVWMVCAILCLRLIWKGALPSFEPPLWARIVFTKSYAVGNLSFSLAHLSGALVLACLVARGVAAEIPMGLENLAAGPTRLDRNPEIQAARWIQAHADPDAIVASRLTSLIHHYSGRRIIWFPPITNPDILMLGIRQYHVQYVIVIGRGFNYYLPPDPVCFEVLYKAYPYAFRLADAKGQVKIYEVLSDALTVPGKAPAS